MQTASESTRPRILRDLLDVRPHPTVVRLEDLEDVSSEWITRAYHITADVKKHLHALRHVLEQPGGLGMFVVGQYGAGKSHFLAYVARELAGGRLVPKPPALRTVSLLNYRSELALEDLIGQAIGVTAAPGDRRVAWDALAKEHPSGLLLILDELSEFLRSKPDTRRLNEDVRFLQFLGEWATDRRFWILAAVQEEVEHVGGLDHGLYRKIKDRYPLRFLLTSAHMKDLLSESILVKKEGYSQGVEAVVQEMRSAFRGLSVRWDDLLEVYPLHPSTLELLEEVRDSFSQSRGVVDFTVTQLRGDPARGIEPFLDRPWGSLLAPDSIVDHFHDLFELSPEFVPIAQQVFPYYRRHLAEIFETDALRALAMRVLKLLVLFHISPARKALTAVEAACFLLYRATRIDPEKNVRVIERVLKRLAEHGGHVVEDGAGFLLRLEDDGAGALEQYLEREKEMLRKSGSSLFDRLSSVLKSDDFSPFGLAREAWQARSLRWHFHERLYSVYLGNESPPLAEGLGFRIRLPWGEGAPASGLYSVEPATLEPAEEHLELAALLKARERPWPVGVEKRIAARLEDRRALFRSQVRTSYLSGSLLTPTGGREPLPRLEKQTPFNAWLDSIFETILRRTYPAFERFAPTYGPLPKEAIRSFVRHALSQDFSGNDLDDFVKVIREAYLVPLGLLRRKGSEYETAARPDRSDLVRLVLPMLEFQPSPRTVYESLAQPVYGLVPDQVTVLLVYLLLVGEIDILKERRSYRELFETLPNPIQYDRIVRGTALGVEQLSALEALCDGLGIRISKQWTVMSQRQALGRLRETVRARREPLDSLLLRLERSGQAPELAEKLRAWGRWCSALESGEDAIQGFARFLEEVGTARRFLSALGDLEGLPERIDRLSGEILRLKHLFEQAARADWLEPSAELRVRSVATPPGLDRPDAAQAWIVQAREAYALYKEAYGARHDSWWKACGEHAALTWKAPRLARSRHLGLESDLRELEQCASGIANARCRGLVNLDFQPLCSCGFDGKTHPLARDLERFAALREAVERAVGSFFSREDVRTRVQAWASEGLEVTPSTRAYLGGTEPLPAFGDLDAFDRHLAGVEVVKSVRVDQLAELVEGRVWDRQALIEVVRRFLEELGSERIRFTTEGRQDQPPWLEWCVEQSLRNGVPLPQGLSAAELKMMGDAVRLEWVGEAALANLERLGFEDVGVEKVLAAILSGAVPLPRSQALTGAVEAAAQVLKPEDAVTPADLARLAERLYTEHARLSRVARQVWLARLDRLATSLGGAEPPGLIEVLKGRGKAQWVVVDCLGLPLLGPVQKALGDFLPSWKPSAHLFALVSGETTTDAFHRDLVGGGIRQSFQKIDCVDRLLHERFLPFADLTRLALAELGAAFRPVRKRLDPALPVLLFADHGFRLARDGSAYVHGGASVLERLVPVIELKPA